MGLEPTPARIRETFATIRYTTLESISVVWGAFLLIPLLLTILLRGIQFRRLAYAVVRADATQRARRRRRHQSLPGANDSVGRDGRRRQYAGVATAIFLGGHESAVRPPLGPYRVAFVLVIFVGGVTELEVVWNFADIMNGLVALPNLTGLILLSGLIARETKAFFAQPEWR